MATTVKIQGMQELARLCRELPINVGKKVLARSVAKGAALIRDDAMRRSPVDTGTLQQAILMKKIPSEKPDVIVDYIVAVRHGVKAQETKKFGGIVNLNAYYWTFQEFGTSKMAAHPFMRPAFESNKGQALDTILNTLSDGIEVEAIALSWGNHGT